MRGGWIVMLGLLGGCTALNPAFGDAIGGTESTSLSETTTDGPTTEPTSDPSVDPSAETTSDPTDDPTLDASASVADTSASAETGESTGATTRPMTSDDSTSLATSTTEESGSSDLGDPAADVLVYSAAIANGNLADIGGGTAVQIGAAICADELEMQGLDLCGGTNHALIRTAPTAFDAPALVANLDRAVFSVEGDAVAGTLQHFLDGDWLVPSLTVVGGGGLAELAEAQLATGGIANSDPNCAGWTTQDGELTTGNVAGGNAWFATDTIGCGTPARILCLCLP